MFQSKIRNRIYLALIATSLAAGNVLAEDDVADLDPNGAFGILRDLWVFMTQLFG